MTRAILRAARHRGGALRQGNHIARAGLTHASGAARLALRPAATAAERHRQNAAVQFRQGHHHRRLDRQQSLAVSPPLLDGLEFDRMGCDERHVQRGQGVGGGRGVVIGRPTHQREAGERDNGIDNRYPVAQEIALDRGA